MNEPTAYLLVFSISPVQEFIAQARKTHDLFIGSQVLSELIRHALDSIRQNEWADKVEVIYPSVASMPDDQQASLPNRLVLQTTGDPRSLGGDLEMTVKLNWVTLAKKTIGKYTHKNGHVDLPEDLRAQIAHYFSFQWVAVELPENDYQRSYNRLEQQLGAQKQIRRFQAMPQAPGRNCSVCGERNFWFYPQSKTKSVKRWIVEGQQRGAFPIISGRSEENEALCAVCFTKRHYQLEDKHFPSTAEIALFRHLERFDDRDCQKAHQTYRKWFPSKEMEKQLYYEENLTSPYFQKNGLAHLTDHLPDIRRDHRHLLKRLEMNTLPSYYALVRFDGDNMGAWLSCQNLDERFSPKAFHQALSQRLAEFAQACQQRIQQPIGAIIYAGGDDYLGFFCLEGLLPALHDLRTWFDEMVNQPLTTEFDLKTPMTFSCGVVIAHYKHPLSDVIQWSKKMEERAKSLEASRSSQDLPKNGLALAMIKSSGEMHEAVLPWTVLTQLPTPQESRLQNPLHHLYEALANHIFSDTFIHHFHQVVRSLLDQNGQMICYEVSDDGRSQSENGLKRIACVELKRLLQRAYLPAIHSLAAKKVCDLRIHGLHQSLMSYLDTTDGWNFLQTLHLVNFMARLARREERRPSHADRH